MTARARRAKPTPDPEGHKMAHRFIEGRVEEFVADMHTSIQALALGWRQNVLRPFCRKHGLTYLTGNGITAFYRDGESLDDDDPLLADVMQTINIEITYNDYFGYYVGNVTEDDL